ncbi:MAG: hypothetical protein LBI82_00505 [Dysgonamonadaceae bacterium]|jgi:hypothetical protein|nr:hypothetical protein [Dysgonamonadaceae bacterium]
MKQKMIKKISMLLLFYFTIAISSLAQNSNQGKDFYVAFASNDLNAVGNVELRLRIVTTEAAQVTLSFTEDSNLKTTFTVPAGKVHNYVLTPAQATASYSALSTNTSRNKKSIRVTASAPILLYASNSGNQSIDVTNILPVGNWGTEYYNFSMSPASSSHFSGIIMVAAENNTVVNWMAGIYSITTTLQAGEMYYYHASTYTGTKFSSNKPFALFENITSATVSGKSSFTFEQLPPTSQWGTRFIVPSNLLNATYARILCNQITQVKVTYTDGSVSNFTLDPAYSTARHKDIIEETPQKRACYISADKPVGVCFYLKSKTYSTEAMPPAEAWLSSLDQMGRNVLVSPFNFNTTHIFGLMEHHVMIITPTSGRENTTVSINGDFPQTLNHPMHWIADNIGGSGYSFGRYYLGTTNGNKLLDATFQFDNPNGVIVLAYGRGNAGTGGSSYLYNAGYTIKNLTTGFTVNGENYSDMNGHIYNSTTNFIFEALSGTPAPVVWKLNGIEIPGSRDLLTVNVNNLPDGEYVLSMTVILNGEEKTFTTSFYVGEKGVISPPDDISAANQGTKFYVAFGRNDTISTVKNNPHNLESITRVNVELILRTTASEETDVTLSFTENSALNKTIRVPAGISDYTLTYNEARASYSGVGTSNAGNKKSICVTSTSPITLHAINTANVSVDATIVFPVKNWGTKYYNVGIVPVGYATGNQCSGFLVIASENNTTVNVFGVRVGYDYTVTLNAGEVYHYYAPGPNGHAVGMRITADKPVAYFESNTQAGLGTFSSYAFEQIAPVNHWGTRFILPTNIYGGGFARVFAAEDTQITVYYSDGASEVLPLQSWNEHHVSIKINNDNHRNSNSCYIVSEKPVCVATFLIPYVYQDMQPTEAWLPPLGQKTRNILLSPLDLNGIHVYLHKRHDVMIITPTAGRENTTVSINGDFPQTLNHPMTWIEDNIGGSGYSFARYFLGEHDAGEKLNTTFRFDNPNGLLVLAYGSGAYTSYFYAAGYGAYDPGFTVNDKNYFDMEGKGYCGVETFEIKAVYSDTKPAYIVWKLNGEEISGTRDEEIFTLSNLPDGYYTLSMTIPTSAGEKTYTTHFYIGGGNVVWTPEMNIHGSFTDRQNWDDSRNWTPTEVPTACHNVYIPGNCHYYPQLTSPAECNKIYFMQGGELGRPDLLTYNEARVQYNFGLSQTQQTRDNDDKDLVLKSSSTEDRMLFSAAVSKPLDRERWYMLSAPLRNVVSGDFAFGGFPLTFMRKFGPIVKEGVNYSVGNWTTPYNSYTETIAPTEGFAFFMYGYDSGQPFNSIRNRGCLESGSFNDLNDLDYLSASLSGQNYGIRETNGILELPFYADETGIKAHRTQTYNPVTQESNFYYVHDGTGPVFNAFSGKKDTFIREDKNKGSYRFIPEEYKSGKWEFQNTLYHPVSDLNSGDEFLAGNPYMSSIDMVKFCKDNAATVEPEFYIWNGTAFDTYSVNTTTGVVTPTVPGTSPYIAPLQSFILKYKGGDILFDVTKISTVRPVNFPSNLRSSVGMREENILRIKAENDYAASYALIGYKDEKNVQKLFSPYGYVPEVYTLAGEIPVNIHYIDNVVETIIPLGIKTTQLGNTTFTFTGMDNYNQASKIVLMDMLLNREIDLAGESSVSYSFENQVKGIQNDRFFIRIQSDITSLPPVEKDEEIRVYSNMSGILISTPASDPIRQIQVYDFQGRKLYDEVLSEISYHQIPDNFNTHCVIVKVKTKDQVKSKKIVLQNKIR